MTEAVTGIDIVREQFRIAAGESIEDLEVDETGYAIELRINAERLRVDAEAGLRIVPDPGTVRVCEFPDRDDVDVIVAVEAESVVSPFYDNLLAQVVARGGSRAEVIQILGAWLSEVRIEGIGSNIPLLRLILEDEEFVEGRHDTGFVARFLERQNVDRIDHLLAEVEALRGPHTTLDRSTVAIEGSDELKVIALAPCVFYASPGQGRAEFVARGRSDPRRYDALLGGGDEAVRGALPRALQRCRRGVSSGRRVRGRANQRPRWTTRVGGGPPFRGAPDCRRARR